MNADKTNGLSALIRVHRRPGILYDPRGHLRERGESGPRSIGTARAHQHRGAAGASTGHRIDIPISHHEAPLRLDAELAHRPQQQPRGGLAAVAGVRRRVRAVVDARDGDAKRREQAKQRGIDRDELAHVEVAEADSLLVSDYNEPVAVPLQFREPLSDTGQQLGFSRIPQVRALSEQRAVAIQKHNPLRRRTDYRSRWRQPFQGHPALDDLAGADMVTDRYGDDLPPICRHAL